LEGFAARAQRALLSVFHTYTNISNVPMRGYFYGDVFAQ
jgi:hypothetical protein